MIFGKAAFGQRRVGIDDSENFFAHAQRHRQHRAHALQHNGAAHEARIGLRVGSQHGFSVSHNFVDHRAADANLAHFAGAVAQTGHGYFQIRILLVAHHDHRAIRRNGLEHHGNDLIERFVEGRSVEQRDANFADQCE